MIRTLAKNWMLLVVCGILNALIASVYLVMWGTDGPVTLHSWNGTVVLLGELMLAAGVCMIAAGAWRSSSGRCWPLVVCGMALCVLGLLEYGFTRYRISFLAVALLGMIMAGSMGFAYVKLAQTLGRAFYAAGVVSAIFATALLPLAFRWIDMRPGTHLELLWFGAYFAFSAACILGIALTVRAERGGDHPRLILGHAH